MLMACSSRSLRYGLPGRQTVVHADVICIRLHVGLRLSSWSSRGASARPVHGHPRPGKSRKTRAHRCSPQEFPCWVRRRCSSPDSFWNSLVSKQCYAGTGEACRFRGESARPRRRICKNRESGLAVTRGVFIITRWQAGKNKCSLSDRIPS